jgi:hypothetical protein
MNDVLITIWAVMACTGSFCVGYLFGNRRVLFWCIEWIKAEHALALAQGRKPRSILDMEKADKEKFKSEGQGCQQVRGET